MDEFIFILHSNVKIEVDVFSFLLPIRFQNLLIYFFLQFSSGFDFISVYKKLAIPNDPLALFYDPFWFSISSSDYFFPLMIFEKPRTLLWWVIQFSLVLATETVQDQGRYNMILSISLIFRVCGIPILPRICRLYFWDGKFQLNSGEISAKTSCKNLFFYIFPEMIS